WCNNERTRLLPGLNAGVSGAEDTDDGPGHALLCAAGFINTKSWSAVPSIADRPHCRALQRRARERNRSRGVLPRRPVVTSLSNLEIYAGASVDNPPGQCASKTENWTCA